MAIKNTLHGYCCIANTTVLVVDVRSQRATTGSEKHRSEDPQVFTCYGVTDGIPENICVQADGY